MKKVVEKAVEKKPLVISFREMIIADLEGKELKYDISKSFANHIYQTTGDLGMLDVAQTIYKTGEIELTEHVKTELAGIVSTPQFPFLAVIKKRLIELFG